MHILHLNQRNQILFRYLRDKEKKREGSSEKGGGGCENSPISPPLDPRLLLLTHIDWPHSLSEIYIFFIKLFYQAIKCVVIARNYRCAKRTIFPKRPHKIVTRNCRDLLSNSRTLPIRRNVVEINKENSLADNSKPWTLLSRSLSKTKRKKEKKNDAEILTYRGQGIIQSFLSLWVASDPGSKLRYQQPSDK